MSDKVNSNEDTREKLLKAEIRLEVQSMFNEQDKRIIEILENQKIIQKEHKELMDFMRNQQRRPWIDKIVWIVLGALASKGVPLIFEKFK